MDAKSKKLEEIISVANQLVELRKDLRPLQAKLNTLRYKHTELDQAWLKAILERDQARWEIPGSLATYDTLIELGFRSLLKDKQKEKEYDEYAESKLVPTRKKLKQKRAALVRWEEKNLEEMQQLRTAVEELEQKEKQLDSKITDCLIALEGLE